MNNLGGGTYTLAIGILNKFIILPCITFCWVLFILFCWRGIIWCLELMRRNHNRPLIREDHVPDKF